MKLLAPSLIVFSILATVFPGSVKAQELPEDDLNQQEEEYYDGNSRRREEEDEKDESRNNMLPYSYPNTLGHGTSDPEAQAGLPDPGGEPIPFDSGVCLLIAAAVGYRAKKAFTSKEKELT